MNEEDKSKKKINKWRLFFSVFYFIIAIALFIIFQDNMFYFKLKEFSWNIDRFIWWGSAVFLGFAATAFNFIHNTDSPFPGYLSYYPIQLLAMATLVFGTFHVFEATSGFLFYYFSFGACFTLGYGVDSYYAFVMNAFSKLNK